MNAMYYPVTDNGGSLAHAAATGDHAEQGEDLSTDKEAGPSIKWTDGDGPGPDIIQIVHSHRSCANSRGREFPEEGIL